MINVEIENVKGELVGTREMSLEELNELQLKDRDFYYTPLGDYSMCEMCNRWVAKSNVCYGEHPKIQKSHFCSYDCVQDAEEDCEYSDRADYLDWDYRMNY